MRIYTETHFVLVEIVNAVKMLEEKITNHEKVIIAPNIGFMYHKKAGIFPGFQQIFLSIKLKNIIRKYKPDRFHFLHYRFARFLDMTKILGFFTHEIRDSGSPLISQLLKNGRWH